MGTVGAVAALKRKTVSSNPDPEIMTNINSAVAILLFFVSLYYIILILGIYSSRNSIPDYKKEMTGNMLFHFCHSSFPVLHISLEN